MRLAAISTVRRFCRGARTTEPRLGQLLQSARVAGPRASRLGSPGRSGTRGRPGRRCVGVPSWGGTGARGVVRFGGNFTLSRLRVVQSSRFIEQQRHVHLPAIARRTFPNVAIIDPPADSKAALDPGGAQPADDLVPVCSLRCDGENFLRLFGISQRACHDRPRQAGTPAGRQRQQAAGGGNVLVKRARSHGTRSAWLNAEMECRLGTHAAGR